MIAQAASRVSSHTDASINERIRLRTQQHLDYHRRHPERIGLRLRELDDEWDVERMLETGSSALTITGLLLAVSRDRRWLLLSLIVQGFFMQHALQGWCPPLPVLRRLGFRTQYEIEQERYALKVLRGDFRHVATEGTGPDRVEEVLDAVTR
jgi:hypothetical protein